MNPINIHKKREMNPVRSRYPIIGIVLTAMLIAGITFVPTRAEAQRGKPAKEQAAIKGESNDAGHKDWINVGARAREYDAIVAKARGIRPKSLSPRDIQQFNARMAPVRAELQKWAARHGFKLKTETVVHELPPKTEESRIRIRYDIKDGTVTCASTMVINGAECTLLSVRTDGSGERYECVYDCPDGDDVNGKGDDVKVMQENS